MRAAGLMLLRAFAWDAGGVWRSGPTLRVAPGGWRVWHEPQPFPAKTAFPAAAFPPPPEEVVVAGVVVGAGAVVVAGAEVDPMVTVCTTVDEDLPSEV